jgi:hypothetical protein
MRFGCDPVITRNATVEAQRGGLLHGTRQNVIAAEQAAHYFAIVIARPAWRIFSPDIPVD